MIWLDATEPKPPLAPVWDLVLVAARKAADGV